MHQTLQILSRHLYSSNLVLCCVLGRSLFLHFLGRRISVFSSYLLLVMVLCSQSQCLFDWSALIADFIVFWDSFRFQVAIGLLERSEDGNIIGRIFFFPYKIFLFVGLQFY